MEATKCILCLNSILSQKSGTDADDDTETADVKINNEINGSENDTANSVFLEFCKCYNIILPVGILSWDFDNEIAPICNECLSTASRLMKLHEELRNLQKVLQETEKCVRIKILQSQKLLNLCQVEDRRILVVRDLIVGPVVRLENTEVPVIDFCSAVVETKSVSGEDDTDYGISFDCDDPVESETEGNEHTTEHSNSDTENSDLVGQTDLQSNHSMTPEVNLESETLTFETHREFGDSEIRRNPARRRRPKKYIEPAEESEHEAELTLETYKSVEMGHTATADTEDTSEVKLDACDNEHEQDPHSADVNDIEDDPYDTDFILPDDSVQTLNEVSQLESKVRQSLDWHRRKHKAKKSAATASQQHHKALFKSTKLGPNRWDYGGREFTIVDGYFACSSCENVKFSVKNKITRHIREYHLGYFNRQCDVCGKTYTHSGSYYTHRKTAHVPVLETQRVICEFCGKEFKTVCHLREHLKRMHICEGELKGCDVCGKSFKTTNEMHIHKRSVHAKEKSVYCEVCGKGFFDTSRLKIHMFVHSEEKSCDCELCSQKFAHYCNLWRHKRQFHGAKTSVAESNDASDAVAAGDRPVDPPKTVQNPEDIMCTVSLKCKLCGLQFQYNRQNNLTRHLLQIHHINVKGYAWKSKGFQRQCVTDKKTQSV